jgi:hypothetical protein
MAKSPTPDGPIKIDLRKEGKGEESQGLHALIDLPEGIEASVFFPVKSGVTHIRVNGESLEGTRADNGTRLVIHLGKAGHYDLITQ